MNPNASTGMRPPRRAILSAGALLLLAGCESMGAKANPGADAATLNFALGLEHEAIAAYRLSAASGLLQPAVLQVATLFMGHHQQHAEALAATIRKLGGAPAAARSDSEYAQSLNLAALRSQTDVLRGAQRLERQAVNAYLGAIPQLADRDLAKVAGRLAADEMMHWTALTQALGEALPPQALTFGA